MKRLVDRFTGENVSLHQVEEFLQEIDQDGDALIQKDELRDFITFGLTLSKQSREEYALRGPLQKTIVKFFYGLDGSARIHAKEQRAIERQKIQEAHLIAQKEERLRQKRLIEIRLKKEREKELKSKPPKRSIFGSRKGRGTKLVKHQPKPEEDNTQETAKIERTEFINFVWREYDKDQSGQIDAEETKQMLENFTGHEVAVDDVQEFLASIDRDGDALIQKSELLDFINTGIDMTESERKEYAARGKLHRTIVEFFYGIDKERKKFKEQKERAMKAAEEDMNKILEERRRKYREASARSKSPEALKKRLSRTPSPSQNGNIRKTPELTSPGDFVQIQLPFLDFESNDKVVGVVTGVRSNGARKVRIDTKGITGSIESNVYLVPHEKLKVVLPEDVAFDILLKPFSIPHGAIDFSQTLRKSRNEKYQNSKKSKLVHRHMNA
eukprot:g9186.t1